MRRRYADLGASTLFTTAAGARPHSCQPAGCGFQRAQADRVGRAGSCRSSQQQHQRAFTVQLRDIFAGRLLDWLALGSDAGEIQLVSREDGSGSRILFETRAMGEEHVALTAVVMPTSQDVVEYVAKNPSAIGYVSRAEVAELITEAGSPQAAAATAPRHVEVIPVEGKLPRALVRSQSMLTQLSLLISNGQPTGRIRQFIDFVLSPAGRLSWPATTLLSASSRPASIPGKRTS